MEEADFEIRNDCIVKAEPKKDKPKDKLQKKKMEKKRNEKRNKKRFIKAQRAEEERRVRSVTGGAKRKSQDGTDVLDPSCLALGQPGMYTDNVFSDIRAQFEFKVRDESRTRIRKAVI